MCVFEVLLMSIDLVIGVVLFILFGLFGLSMVLGPILINFYKEKGELFDVNFLVIFDGKIKLTERGNKIQRVVRYVSLFSFFWFVVIFSYGYNFRN